MRQNNNRLFFFYGTVKIKKLKIHSYGIFLFFSYYMCYYSFFNYNVDFLFFCITLFCVKIYVSHADNVQIELKLAYCKSRARVAQTMTNHFETQITLQKTNYTYNRLHHH